MKRKNRKNRIIYFTALLLAATLVFLCFHARNARADVATDTLTIRVGYYGMDLSEYVELATYSWADMLEWFDYGEEAYSYFQGKEKALEPGIYSSYTCIVDSARGVYLTDLINDAGIYYGDIYNLLFYVRDHDDIWCAFDRDDLFGSRYYYENMPGHRTVYYNDAMRVTGYSFEEAEGYGWQVEPMMAFEDNWAVYTEDFEDIYEDFSSLNTANRFRLLFGQMYPTESLTNKSAKYVSTIFVTLYGAPRYTNIPKLDGTIGVHEVELVVDVDNPILKDALSELMRLTSSNEDVLRILGMTVTPDDYFENIAVVNITYEIVGEGQAELGIGYGSVEMEFRPDENTSEEDLESNGLIFVNTEDFIQEPTEEPTPEPMDEPGLTDEPGPTEEPEPTDEPGPTEEPEPTDEPGPTEEPEPTDEPGPTEEPTNKPTPEPTPKPTPEPTETPEPSPVETPTPKPTKEPVPEPTGTPLPVAPVEEEDGPGDDPDEDLFNFGDPQEDEPVTAEDPPADEIQEEFTVEQEPEIEFATAEIPKKANGISAEVTTSHNSEILLKKLSNEAAAGLDKTLGKNAVKSDMSIALNSYEPANKEITELQILDNSEEKEAFKRRVLIATAIACAALAALGGAMSALSYRTLLAKERIIPPAERFMKWIRGE